MDLLAEIPRLRLNNPWALVALLLIPCAIYLAWRSISGLGRVRGKLAVALRCAVLLLLVGALALPEMMKQVADRTVLFILDISRSIPTEQRHRAEQFMTEAAKSTRVDKDKLGVISFAGRAAIEQLPDTAIHVRQPSAASDLEATDVGAALQLGMASLLPNTVGRVVLFTDGNENVGSSDASVQALAAAGVPVDVLPLVYKAGGEVLVERLTAPSTARKEEAINLQLLLKSSRNTSGRLELYRNDVVVDLDPESDSTGHPVKLSAGSNRFVIPVTPGTPGLHRYKMAFVPDDLAADAIVENNHATAATVVAGQEPILFISGNDAGTTPAAAANDPLVAALMDEGVECEVVDVSEALLDTAGLANRPLVILSNVAAVNLSEAAQQALTTYVRDLGGGLIVIGGDQSFSAGGYGGSRLESLLPVYTDRDRLMTLSSALVLVIDRSGSMDGEKLAMAREAAVRTAQLLASLDLLGVLAFEGGFDWIVPLGRNTNKNASIARIKNITCGRGTNMFPAMEETGKALMGANANVRHMIVLTDGQSMPGDFENFARKSGQNKITISTVAVGSDADRNLLSTIARLSKGRFYSVDDSTKLPRVFVRETAMIARTGLYEKPFSPTLRVGLDDEPTAGIDPATIPQLKGYVLTSPRPDATVAITRKTGGLGDPILAYWQVGLGRTTAFTSGMWNRWGPDWVGWSGFSKLWTQIVRWTARPATLKGWSVSSTLERGMVRLSAEADPELIAQGRYPNLACKIVGPDGAVSSLPLSPIGPGRFDGEFDAKKSGDYVVRLVDSTGQGAAFYTVVSVACPEELREVRSDEARVRDIALKTGGRILDADRPQEVLTEPDLRRTHTFYPIHAALFMLAAGLFLMDVAVRRISIDPVRTKAWMSKWLNPFGRRKSEPTEVVMAGLKAARQRAQTPRKTDDSPPPPQVRQTDSIPLSPVGDPNRAGLSPARSAADKPQSLELLDGAKPAQPAKPLTKAPVADDTPMTARLLKTKRRAREEIDQQGKGDSKS